MIAVGEGAQAASYQGHGAEAGAGLAGCVGAGGVLLAVLTVTRGLQPVVRACKGHLHGCWQRPLELLQDKQSFSSVLNTHLKVFLFCLWNLDFSLLFLCEVESQWSSHMESHMEITGRNDRSVRQFCVFREKNLKLMLHQDWT